MTNMPAFRVSRAIAVLFCLLWAAAYATNAQQPETRVVPVTVVTTDGKPVANLQSQNIRVHSSGMQLKSFSLDTSPRRIVLLLDTSGSMSETDHGKLRIAVALRLVNLFLDNASAADSFALYQFSDAPREVVPFTNDVAAIRQAMSPISSLKKAQMVGHTNIGDALNAILTNSQESVAFGESIIIFSDGEFVSDQGKPTPLAPFAPALALHGVRLFLVLPQEREAASSDTQSAASDQTQVPAARQQLPVHDNTPLGWYDPKTVVADSELFVAGVGGESFAPADYSEGLPTSRVFRSNDLTRRMKSLWSAIRSTYRLELQFAKSLEKPERLRLAIVDERGKALHNLTVLSAEFAYPDAGHQFSPR